MQNNNKRVLMALSGGVDSAVCVRLLQQAGYDVTGVVIRFSPAHDAAVNAAGQAAKELGIPLEVADCQELFAKEVIGDFCHEYASGRTPNPCVNCNPKVKFYTLVEQADRMGIPFIATGHYARIVKLENTYHIACAQNLARDQSYMLYRLPQSILSRLILPAGEMDKVHVRELAVENGLSSANAPDSQEICFIPDGDYASYITAQGYPIKPGHFIGPDGQDLGPHQGIIHYTVGQRRGLGVSLGQPAFVKRIDESGDVHLAFAEDILAHSLSLKDVLATEGTLPAGEYGVKIRSMAKQVPCQLEIQDGNYRVLFEQAQRAPAPGQHAVLYNGDLVMGGGIISCVHYE